jgi:hypothetical protein
MLAQTAAFIVPQQTIAGLSILPRGVLRHRILEKVQAEKAQGVKCSATIDMISRATLIAY